MEHLYVSAWYEAVQYITRHLGLQFSWAGLAFTMKKNSIAFGAPGIEPRWTSSAKSGIGTAYNSSSCIWFTLSHGIVNEIYFPHVDSPNTRHLQFLITDGESFCHEERRDLLHQTEYPEQDALLYRLTNYDPERRYASLRNSSWIPTRPFC